MTILHGLREKMLTIYLYFYTEISVISVKVCNSERMSQESWTLVLFLQEHLLFIPPLASCKTSGLLQRCPSGQALFDSIRSKEL